MTQRDLTAGMLSAIAAGHVRPFLLYEGEFVSGGSPAWLRLWTGVGALSWDSKTWTGGGELLAISVIPEATGVRAEGFTVSLTGMKSANVSLALGSLKRNGSCKLWKGALDASGAVVDSPYLFKRGRLDRVVIDDSGDSGTITAHYENRLIAVTEPRERRYTHEDQQLRSPGDKGFEFVEALQDATFGL